MGADNTLFRVKCNVRHTASILRYSKNTKSCLKIKINANNAVHRKKSTTIVVMALNLAVQQTKVR